MPRSVRITEARAKLAELIREVEILGKEIVIARRDEPVAKLVPVESRNPKRRRLGFDRGRLVVPDDFDDPLPSELINDFEGGSGV